MKNLKAEYEKITPDDDFRERIEKTMKTENKKLSKKRFWKISSTAAAALVVAAVIGVNAVPPLAYAMSDVPILSSFVRVVTFGRFEHSENGYDAKIATPKIEGLSDKELENKLNKQFKDNADKIIAAYKKDVSELKAEYGDDSIHMGIISDYIVKTDNDDYLAIDLYTLSIAGSSSTVHSFYTIDKKTGKLLTLKGLFKDGADYVSVLTDYIKGEMARENAENDGLYDLEGDFAFKQIKPDQNFYINDKGELVICFDKYEVAAGAQGSPEFIIPNDIIKDILKK